MCFFTRAVEDAYIHLNVFISEWSVIMSIRDGIYFYTNKHIRTTRTKASRDPRFLSRDGAAPVDEFGDLGTLVVLLMGMFLVLAMGP